MTADRLPVVTWRHPAGTSLNVDRAQRSGGAGTSWKGISTKEGTEAVNTGPAPEEWHCAPGMEVRGHGGPGLSCRAQETPARSRGSDCLQISTSP